MILSLSLKNFYSFKAKQNINFLVNKNAPRTEGYANTALHGERATKLAVVIGANSSGKTNLLKAISFLQWFIVSTFNWQRDKEIPIKSFLFKKFKHGGETIELSATFELGGNIYFYEIVLTPKQVISEILKAQGKHKRYKEVFSRKWSIPQKEYLYKFNKSTFRVPENFSQIVRNNASVVSTAAQLNEQTSVNIADFWKKVTTNVVEYGMLEGPQVPLNKAAEFFYNNASLRSKAESLLATFDLGLTGFEIHKKIQEGKEQQQSIFQPYGKHLDINGREYDLPFRYESGGTKNLFTILTDLLGALSSGGVVVIDEFDANLHPHVLPELINLFQSKEINTKNAQLIFSTHHLEILNHLDKYQIFLVERNKFKSSEVWRLDEVKGVRSVDNYYNKYISGRYGAIPKI